MIMSKLISFFLVIGIMGLSSQPANAARFSFKQTGFHGTIENSDTGETSSFKGGLVTGSFTAEDIAGNFDENGKNIPDGKIIVCYSRACSDFGYDKISNFSIHFSGNAAFDSLNYEYDPSDPSTARGLVGLEYDPLAKYFVLSFGDYWNTFGYTGENTPFGIVSWVNGVLAGTEEPLQISQVPLPNILGLFVVSAFGMVSRNRRKLNTSHPL